MESSMWVQQQMAIEQNPAFACPAEQRQQDCMHDECGGTVCDTDLMNVRLERFKITRSIQRLPSLRMPPDTTIKWPMTEDK